MKTRIDSICVATVLLVSGSACGEEALELTHDNQPEQGDRQVAPCPTTPSPQRDPCAAATESGQLIHVGEEIAPPAAISSGTAFGIDFSDSGALYVLASSGLWRYVDAAWELLTDDTGDLPPYTFLGAMVVHDDCESFGDEVGRFVRYN